MVKPARLMRKRRPTGAPKTRRCISCPPRRRCAGWADGIGTCRYCGVRCACGWHAHFYCSVALTSAEMFGAPGISSIAATRRERRPS